MYFGVTHLSQFGWISQSITRFIVYSVKSQVQKPRNLKQLILNS